MIPLPIVSFDIQDQGFLYGTYWTGTEEVLRVLDLGSNSISDIGVLAGVTSNFAESTIDMQNGLYFKGTNLGVTVIDVETGDVTQSYLASQFQNLKGYEYDGASGNLYCSYWTGSEEVFAFLDLSTGIFTDVGVLDGVNTLSSGESTFDVVNGKYFQRTNLGLIVVDIQNANILQTIPISSPYLKGFEYDMVSGNLYCSYWTGSQEVFGFLDLDTGGFTSIGVLDGVSILTQGASSFSSETGRYFMSTNLGTTVVDVTSAEILQTNNSTLRLPEFIASNFLGSICIDAEIQAGLGGGTPTGGVYSGAGITDDGNGITYSFDPSAAGVGVHRITYDFTDANGCMTSASDDVEVFDLPSVNFSAPEFICLDAGLQTSLGEGIPGVGVYSGPGVSDDGTGMTYSFDPVAAGVGVHTLIYSYDDSNGCVGLFSHDIKVFDCGFEIVDPCACLDNATPRDCNDNTGGDDGQFSEIVTISGAAGPFPIGMTWSIVEATGALDANNVPAVGTQSAGVAVPTDGSMTLAFNDGIYELPFVHVDDVGYTLMIEGPFAIGSTANVTFTISNKCQYPDPVFNPEIPDTLNVGDQTILLNGEDSNGGAEEKYLKLLIVTSM